MSDSYQAIYDAVRSRISNGDIGRAIHDVAWQHFDISHAITMLRDDISYSVAIVKEAHLRPSVLYRPALYPDGDKWCALYGENLQDGLAGFGDTPDEAMVAFDKAWASEKRPTAANPTKDRIMALHDETMAMLKGEAGNGEVMPRGEKPSGIK